VRSCDLLVREGFDVRVALLPGGQDPDTFVRNRGGEAYQLLVDEARPYLEFLLDRAARRHNLADPRGRLAFLQDMLGVAAGIPDAASRDYFADRVALRAGFAEEVVRQEIRRSAVARRGAPPAPRLTGAALTDAERDLLIQLLNEPEAALDAMAELEEADLDGLAARSLLQHAVQLRDQVPEHVPGLLLQRLTEEEVSLFTGLPARTASPSPPADCVRTLKLKRQERERLALQRQIDSLQEQVAAPSDAELNDLLARKLQEARAAHPD
jgi:DNA primase